MFKRKNNSLSIKDYIEALNKKIENNKIEK